MFAILRFGDKQYRVIPGEAIDIERLDIEPNENVSFKDILLISKNDNDVIISKSELAKYKVNCSVIKEYRDDKIIVFKKKRRKGYTKTRGHRQYRTLLLVKDIVQE